MTNTSSSNQQLGFMLGDLEALVASTGVHRLSADLIPVAATPQPHVHWLDDPDPSRCLTQNQIAIRAHDNLLWSIQLSYNGHMYTRLADLLFR